MVHGLEIFRSTFKEYAGQYVFIGGTACDILMDELGAAFRATKDLDIVLIIERLDASFAEKFWSFIEDGGYQHRNKGSGKNQFYRFVQPSQPDYPAMIELFCRKPSTFELKFDTGLTPIYIEDSIASLSAILLNDTYYDVLTKSQKIVQECSVIDIPTLVLFKIKAWLDLKDKYSRGEKVDSKNISKHKNDVFRLLAVILPGDSAVISQDIQADIRQFIEMIHDDKPDLKNLGIKNASLDEMLVLLQSIYSLRPQD